jgi:hypothetical protein
MEITTPQTPGADSLSIHRAFVVRFYADLEVSPDRVCGRVEHVVSGEGAEFRSVAELLAFITSVIYARASRTQEQT